MNKQEKNKQKKKNERNKRVKLKLANRREYARKERKIVLEEERAKRETELLVNGKQKPIVNDINKSKEVAKLKEELIKEQLEKNLQILQALEDQYDLEQKNRTELNQRLESEGHFTLREKLDALHKNNLESHEISEDTKEQ
jgi:uncharacterized surface protein with fasciclin (FAS1) repeats